MDEKALNKAFEYIDAMAAKLGVASEHVYGILIKQAFVSGLIKTIIGIAAIIFVISVFRKVIKWATNRGDEEDILFVYFFGGIACLFIITILLMMTYGGVMSLINPEYYAIKEIIKVIGGGN